VSCSVTSRVRATMLFMPLANASTLDRSSFRSRDRMRTSFVEALWSPALVATCARGPFSLRRGLELDQMYFKLSITFSCCLLTISPPKRRRRPCWVALTRAVMPLTD
jgi:hypothetical protein